MMSQPLFAIPSGHTRAVVMALFVTFLWSTSWVLIKIGLADIPALTFAGLRYGCAFLCLCPLLLKRPSQRLNISHWKQLIALGLLFVAITQGAQFISLAYLPASAVSLLLNFTTPVVAVLSLIFLSERANARQWTGIGIFLAGVLLYFYPVAFPSNQVIGIVAALIGVFANATSAILGRAINRSSQIDPFMVTLVSIGIGAAILIGVSLLLWGWPRLTPLNWAIIGWLAVVNTAFAFTLWNAALRTLSATESSNINNTMLIQIAVLAWLLLGEPLNTRQILGMALAVIGTLTIQRGRTVGIKSD